jgi:type II secretory pathway component PulF
MLRQWCCAYMSGIARIYWAYELAGFFQAVALLVRGGKGLAESMNMALVVTHNRYIKKRLLMCVRLITEGYALDHAFMQSCGTYAKPDIAPLLLVGTESGMLAPVLEQSARLYFDYAQQQLNRVILFVQPVLMGILGLFVALLLYAVYVPIIQLPQTISSLAL